MSPTNPDGTSYPENPDIDSLLSTGEFNNNNYTLTLWPNPTNNIIHFDNNNGISNETIPQISIVDMTGKQVFNGFNIIEGQGIDVSQLQDGMYVIKIKEINGFQAIKRFIKE